MIRIDLGAEGLANTRFAISPLHAAVELLYFRECAPHTVARGWRAAADETLTSRGLDLLAAIVREGVYGYMPDFVGPAPDGFESDADVELHRVATTPGSRVRYEMTTLLVDGPAWSDTAGRPSAVLRAALEHGEEHFAEAIAGQLAQFWYLMLSHHWPRIRERLEKDIAQRTRTLAREGFAAMTATLHPTMAWKQSGLNLEMSCGPTTSHGRITADAMILMPTAFGHRPLHTLDPRDAPHYRAPMITYPSRASAAATAPPLNELIGSTRAQLLAQLAAPHTTEQLAQDLHLSPSTVSYHLQVLHRAGLVSRIRRSRHVYYHSTPSAPGAARTSAAAATAAKR